MAEGAIIVAAVIGAAATVYSSNKSEDSADRTYAATQAQYRAQNAAAALSAEADANAIWGTAKASADAIQSQAILERDLFYKEAESARAIAFSNIEAMRQEGAESVRRLRGEQETMEAKSRAMAGASGVRMEGSIELAQDNFEQGNKNNLNWLNKSYDSKLSIASLEANELYNMYHQKANTAYAVANVRAEELMAGANYSAGALMTQAEYYSRASTNITKTDDEYIAFIKSDSANDGNYK